MAKKKQAKKNSKQTHVKRTKSAQPHSLWDHLKRMFLVLTPFLVSAVILSNYLISNTPTTAVMGLSTTASGSANHIPCIYPGPETTHYFLFWKLPVQYPYPCPTFTPKITPTGTITPTVVPFGQSVNLYGTYYDSNMQLFTVPIRTVVQNLQTHKVYVITTSPTWKLTNILPGQYRVLLSPFKNYTIKEAVCINCSTASSWITLNTNMLYITIPGSLTTHNFENLYLQFIPKTTPQGK